jgi:hypothetical protein
VDSAHVWRLDYSRDFAGYSGELELSLSLGDLNRLHALAARLQNAADLEHGLA